MTINRLQTIGVKRFGFCLIDHCRVSKIDSPEMVNLRILNEFSGKCPVFEIPSMGSGLINLEKIKASQKKFKKSLAQIMEIVWTADRFRSTTNLNRFLLTNYWLTTVSWTGDDCRCFFVVSLKTCDRDNRCSLKIELCNSRNPQTLFLLEDGVWVLTHWENNRTTSV